MDRLTLEHIAPYLPYGLRMQNEFGDEWTINMTAFDSFLTKVINESLPILRPLSDLTKEIEHNGEKFVPVLKISEMYGIDIMTDDTSSLIMPITMEPYVAFRQLIEWHFDVFNMIPRKLAININKLKGGGK